MAYHPYHFVSEVLLHPVYSASGSSCHEDSSPAQNTLRVWHQARLSPWGPCLFTDLLAVWEWSCFALQVIVQEIVCYNQAKIQT